jgi:hypothetical protein
MDFRLMTTLANNNSNTYLPILDAFGIVALMIPLACLVIYVIRRRIFTATYGKHSHKRKRKNELLAGKSILQKLTLYFMHEQRSNLKIKKKVKRLLCFYYTYAMLTIVIALSFLFIPNNPMIRNIEWWVFIAWMLFVPFAWKV